MKKKREEYIPQFDYDDFPITETPKSKVLKCNKCGKYSVSLHNGLCFECRQEEPSSDTLKEMLEKETKRKNKAKLIFEIVLFSISVLLLILVLLNIIPLESPLGEAIAHGAMTGFVGSLLIFLIEAICKIIKLFGSLFKKTGFFLKKTFSSLKESTNKKIKETTDYCKKQIEEHKFKKNDINNNGVSSADEIKKFKELLDIGAITEEEFNAKKKQLLGL